MTQLDGIVVDGTLYYLVRDLFEKKVVSRTSLYRREKEKKITIYKNLNGERMIKAEDFTRFLKKNSTAA